MNENFLALTCGDPAGVGPELLLRALGEPPEARGARLVAYANEKLLRRVSAASGVPFPRGVAAVCPGGAWPETGHLIVDMECGADAVEPGRVSAACGAFAHASICAAAADVMAGKASALVTAPASKQAFHLAGVDFPGHTELLAHMTGARDVRMMFWSPRLRLVLDSIHEPLRDVPRLLNRAHLAQTIRHARAAGAVGVLALNPHAGEGGLFGDEERGIILPAVEDVRREGFHVEGPLVPDTAFCWLADPAQPAPFGAYVALYHDQGLIPFKMAAFHDGVNVTLGLPIVRTSPDHGTAFDIAWQGRADPRSFFNAINVARLTGRGLSSP